MSKFIAALFAISQDMDTTQSFSGSSVLKNPPARQETQFWSLGQEEPLEKEMAAHSIILAWEIPRTEDPGKLQFMGSQSQIPLNN